MRKVGLIVFLVLVLILVLLLVLPNLKGCSSSREVGEEESSSGSSLASLAARFLTGESGDGLCDYCGAPATTKKRGYELCSDCYEQALDYYNSHYK